MAPDDCKLDRLRDEPAIATSVAASARRSEKPDHYCREVVPPAVGGGQTTSCGKVLCAGSDSTNEMILATANGNCENNRTSQELKRPIVNNGQRINKYGSFEGRQQSSDAASGHSLHLAAGGDTKRPSTLSAYIVGKDWKNFGGAGGDGKDTREESQRRKGAEGGGGGGDGDDGEISKPQRTRLERVAKHVPGLGIILSLIASLFLGTAGMLVKLTTSVHGIEVAVMRAVIQLIIYSAIIGGRGIRWLPERAELIPVALRSGMGGLSITLSYSALKLIPLGDATTIRFSLPIWTMIMSYFFLRESCNSFKVFAVAISISGVVLVTKPDMCVMLLHRLLNWIHLESNAELTANELAYDRARVEELAFLIEAPLSSGDNLVGPGGLVSSSSSSSSSHSLFNQTFDSTQQVVMRDVSDMVATPTYSTDAMRQFEGCLMALGSSICLSISIIALRLCKRTPSEVVIFWLSALSIIIGTLTLLAMDEWSVPDNWRDVLYILLNGVCGALGQWFMTSALKVEQSGVIALARTFDIEVAFLYSAFLLGEEIRMTSILGSILVSLGVVSVVVPKWLGCGLVAPEESGRASETTTSAISPPSDSDAASSHSSNGGDNQLTTTTTTTTTATSAGDTVGGRPGTGAQQQQPQQLVGVLDQQPGANRH